jgi:hypothetical protein
MACLSFVVEFGGQNGQYIRTFVHGEWIVVWDAVAYFSCLYWYGQLELICGAFLVADGITS